ncbi:MAG: histone deacetylase [Methanomicrobiaceae archaeon]|nr:histone deacetylase [Methanomicrobiaceae archaeon]
MTTGIVYHPAFLTHEQHPLHPERRERLAYTDDQLTEEGMWEDPRILRLHPRPATREELSWVHDERYLNFLEQSSRTGGVIDLDTVIPPGLFAQVRLAAGGGLVAGESVMAGTVRNAFAMVRPPGHHAGTCSGGGFCYVNNVAILVQSLKRKGCAKILILDWDAHHGNGTQEIFYEDPDVLFTSIHQSGFYPGTGDATEIGAGEGTGYTINMPVPAGSSDEVYQYLLAEVIGPVAEEFNPDFIAVSAGLDNHFTDPLAGLALTAGGYAATMAFAVELAGRLCAGRLAAVLEGGYSVEGGLPYTTIGIIAALAGMDLSGIRDPSSYGPLFRRAFNPGALRHVQETVRLLRTVHGNIWHCLS